MKLQIKNIGKIKEASIELNGITIVAGENNTGKSTIGRVLYSVFESFYDIDDKINQQKYLFVLEQLKGKVSSPSSLLRRLPLRELEKACKLIVDKINTTDDVDQFIIRALQETLGKGIVIYEQETMIRNIKRMAEYSEAYLVDFIINDMFNIEFIKQYKSLNEGAGNPYVDLQFKNDREKILIEYNTKSQLKVKEYVPIDHKIFYSDAPIDTNEQIFSRRIIMNHKDKMNTVFRNFNNYEENLFNQVMGDENFKNIESKLIEIIDGDFINELNKTVFFDRSMNKIIELDNLSTGIKSLSHLFLCIKSRYIEENSTIILDEPEIHLHPEWQLKLAEILVIMQKELNLHILLTTHSPYFVNAIEVYSKKYKITKKCSYYLSVLSNENVVTFEDVSSDISYIYKLLARPFQILIAEEEKMDEDY